eukprot:3386737-Rhodomonas_salina.1
MVQFSQRPEIFLQTSGNGTLVFVVAEHFNGLITFNLSLEDTGGVDSGGENTTTVPMNISVLSVNDAPSFDLQNPVVEVLEDAGLQQIALFAQNISAGPPDEIGQNLTFSFEYVSGDVVLFSHEPEILLSDILISSGSNSSFLNGTNSSDSNSTDQKGTLVFRTALHSNGYMTMNLSLQDDGGVARGGSNITTKTIVISILAVNDNPTFAIASLLTIREDEFSLNNASLSNVITNISRGAPDEVNQTLTFFLIRTDGNSSLFSSYPSVVVDGDTAFLIFSTIENAYGNATFLVSARDDAAEYNLSISQQFTLQVLPVNDPPSAPISPLVICEDPQNGSTYVYESLYVPHPGPLESHQVVSFSVTFFEGSGSLFVSGPVIHNDGTVIFELVPFLFGEATFHVILQDDGGTANGGVNASQQLNWTIVINARPSFDLPDAFSVDEDASQSAYPVGSNIILGLPNATVPGFFVLAPDYYRAISADTWSSSLSNLFGNASGAGNQLFATGSQITLDTLGNLTFVLEEHRHGEVVFNVTLFNGGAPQCNGSFGTSFTQQFTLKVRPVNDRPEFRVQNSLVVLNEDERLTSAGYAFNVTQGGWMEEYQYLQFSYVQLTGSVGAFQLLSLKCEDIEPSLCTARTATLDIVPFPNRFGEASFAIRLSDDGDNSFGGESVSFPQMINITVNPVNDPPTFRLTTSTVLVNQDTRCVASEIGLSTWRSPAACSQIQQDDAVHEHLDFALLISLGQWEDGPENCAGQDLCEDQQGTFHVTALSEADALALFSVLPSINVSTGALSFTLMPNATGQVTFAVSLQDSGALDGSNKTSDVKFFTIDVLLFNKPPSFSVLGNITVFEESGFFSSPAVSNITTDSMDNLGEPFQTVTFSVTVDRPELFTSGPIITENGTLQFVPAPERFGPVLASVTVQDSGGVNNNAVDVFTLPIRIEILPVNNAPTFVIQSVVSAFESVGQELIGSFATDISPGSSFEDCEVVDPFCQRQTVTFVVDDITNPQLFEIFPAVSVDGTLSFDPAPRNTGFSVVTLRLVDGGGLNANEQFSGTYTSVRQSFVIEIVSVDDPPAFSVPWQVPFLAA